MHEDAGGIVTGRSGNSAGGPRSRVWLVGAIEDGRCTVLGGVASADSSCVDCWIEGGVWSINGRFWAAPLLNSVAVNIIVTIATRSNILLNFPTAANILIHFIKDPGPGAWQLCCGVAP